MPSLVVIKVDPQQERDLEETLSGVPDGAAKAIKGAINKTLNKLKTAMARAVAENVYLTAAQAKEQLSIRPASEEILAGEVAGTRKAIALSKFRYQQTKEGVQSWVSRKKGGATLLKHGFVATVKPSGHVGIFIRNGVKIAPKQGSYAGKILKRGSLRGQVMKRQPIEQRFGPDVYSVITGVKGVLEKLQEDAQKDLTEQQLPSQIDRLLGRKKADESP